ncbi:hypothetical protein BDV93DRAFT_605663 [Ceratobasidium sp. AG-I]|nr:hypothetical protein BDV93DRAFT_605663 [Ceratobasidium sp. AG-I]
MTSPVPPRYTIVSLTPLAEPDIEAPPPLLIHPQIHYQYADDPPTAIPVSLSSEAQVLYMDFNPDDPSQTRVRSASNSLVSTGLAVSDAVGALPVENSHLYIISAGELQVNNNLKETDPRSTLNYYRERLGTVRHVMEQDHVHSQAAVLETNSTENGADQ